MQLSIYNQIYLNFLAESDLYFVYCSTCQETSGHSRDDPSKTCDVCNTPFQYQCTKCLRYYRSLGGLYAHQRYQCDKELVMDCDSCDYRTSFKNELVQHMQHNHDSKSVKTCKKCNKTYAVRTDQAHEKVCGRKVLFKCKLCSYLTDTKRCLISHMNNHRIEQTPEKDKPFSCLACLKRFEKISYLLAHKKKCTHTFEFSTAPR